MQPRVQHVRPLGPVRSCMLDRINTHVAVLKVDAQLQVAWRDMGWRVGQPPSSWSRSQSHGARRPSHCACPWSRHQSLIHASYQTQKTSSSPSQAPHLYSPTREQLYTRLAPSYVSSQLPCRPLFWLYASVMPGRSFRASLWAVLFLRSTFAAALVFNDFCGRCASLPRRGTSRAHS